MNLLAPDTLPMMLLSHRRQHHDLCAFELRVAVQQPSSVPLLR